VPALEGHQRTPKPAALAGATAACRSHETARHRHSKQMGGGLPSRRAAAAPASRAFPQAPRGLCQQSIFFPSAIVRPANGVAAHRRAKRDR
jgi:hypothetical protein